MQLGSCTLQDHVCQGEGLAMKEFAFKRLKEQSAQPSQSLYLVEELNPSGEL